MVYHKIHPVLKDKIWKCNLQADHVQNFVNDPFWRAVVQAWATYHFQPHVDNPSGQVVWLNSHILIGNVPVCWINAYNKGLIFVHQLWNNKKLISWRQAEHQFGLTLLQFHGLVTAIPLKWKSFYREEDIEHDPIEPSIPTTATVYRAISKTDFVLIQKCRVWEKRINVEISYQDFISGIVNIPKVQTFLSIVAFNIG